MSCIYNQLDPSDTKMEIVFSNNIVHNSILVFVSFKRPRYHTADKKHLAALAALKLNIVKFNILIAEHFGVVLVYVSAMWADNLIVY